MKNILLKLTTITLCVITILSCQTYNDTLDSQLRDRSETFSISMPAPPRTYLGDKTNNTYPVFWSESDCIVVNGIKSQKAQINDEDKSVASFLVEGSYSSPYNITYPYCTTTTADAPKVVFPAEQLCVENSFATDSAPMYGWTTTTSSSTELKHLAGVFRFAVTTKESNIALEKIVITSDSSKLSGEFMVDCESGALSPTANTNNTITYTLPSNYTLSTSKECIFYIALPATNSGKCTVEFLERSGNKMTARLGNRSIKAGVVCEFKPIEYIRGEIYTLPAMDTEEDILEITNYIACGYVKDVNDNPIPNVAVSDGFTVVQTDENGYYTLSVSKDCWYIFISLPAEYEVPINEYGQPCFFQRYKADKGIYNFTLTPLAGGKEKTFALFTFGDPQVGNASVKLAEFKNYAVPGIKTHATELINSGIPCYGITLGDIVSSGTNNNDNYLRDDMRNGFAVFKTGIPVFQVMGNHDYTYCDESTPLITDTYSSTLNLKAQRSHEDMFGPVNYSFNRGDFHIVGMKDIVYNSNINGGSYSYGFTPEQFEWLKQDLALVPKEKAVVLCVHIQILNRTANYTQEVKELLNQFNDAHIFSGHTHITRNYEHSVEGLSTTKIYEHNAGAVCGAWWSSRMCGDGVPNGYQVHIGGNDSNGGGKFVDGYFIGYYEGTNSRNHQMRLYRGNAITGGPIPTKPEDNPVGAKGYYRFNFGENELIANIYNADSKWVIKVYEDNVYSGNMTKIPSNNPAFSTLVGDSSFDNPRRYPDGVVSSHDMYTAGLNLGVLGRMSEAGMGSGAWSNCTHLYRYTLKNKDAEIKVVATDRFGNEYTETKITEGTDYSLTKKP